MNTVRYDGYAVTCLNARGEREQIGGLHDPATLAHLVTLQAFVYETEQGVVSVRLESKVRGPRQGYWSAYKRFGGKLHKTYVASAFALDPYNLDEAAQRLLSQAGLSNSPPSIAQAQTWGSRIGTARRDSANSVLPGEEDE